MSEKSESRNGNPNHNQCSPSPLLAEKTVLVDADGSLTLKETEYPQGEDSKMPEIIKKLGSPNFPAAEIHRLIALENALVTRRMGERRDNLDATTVVKDATAQVKVLRALAKAVKEADRLANRDVLNFDGKKFQFVFDELLLYYEESAKEALGSRSDEIVQRVMKSFRDKIGMKEADLRRKTEKIGTEKSD